MKSLWSKFLATIRSGSSSLKKEEMRLLGELVLRVEGIEHHLTDDENDDDAVNKYAPNLADHGNQVDSALASYDDAKAHSNT
jgi:hypothetical protein